MKQPDRAIAVLQDHPLPRGIPDKALKPNFSQNVLEASMSLTARLTENAPIYAPLAKLASLDPVLSLSFKS